MSPDPRTNRWRTRLVVSTVLCLAWIAPHCCGTAQAAADAAHFWLSTSSSGSPGPEAPAVGMTVGETTTLYLWGRPTEGLQLTNVSLNIITSATGLDLVDGSFLIKNTIDGSSDRFEFLDDSTSGAPLLSEYSMADVASGDADELYGWGGFTLYHDLANRGIGPICSEAEMGCEVASDGEPAWLLGEFMIAATTAGSVDLSLQIGDLGMNETTLSSGDYDFDGETEASDYTLWLGSFGSDSLLAADGNDNGVVDAADYTVWRDHVGDLASLGSSASTDVRFGADAGAGTEPTHNASTDRSVNLGGDDPDATITIAPPSASVPEPTALMLALLGGCAHGLRRRAR